MPSDILTSTYENAQTQIRTMIFYCSSNSIEIIRILPSLPFIRSLKVYDFRPYSTSILKPTFQFDYCKQLDFGFIPYSIETPAHNSLLMLLPCFPNIKKLTIEISKQF